MEELRIIKKYPNRRLYDTEKSKYITLEDVKQLVLENKNFIIKDVKSEIDLTRNTLLQIIIEQEDRGKPLFSSQTLSHLIRFYGDSNQSAASDYLQRSITQFVSEKESGSLLNNSTSSISLTNAVAEEA